MATLQPLLRGEEVDFDWRGQVSPIRHIMPNDGFVDFDTKIPLYVSGFGPRSLGLAGKYGDGAVLSIPPDPVFMDRIWSAIERGAVEAGTSLDRSSYLTCSLTTIVVLEPGEATDSDRVKDLCGAFAMASLHYSYDQFRNYGRAPSGPAADVWDAYRAVVEKVEPERRHQRVHAGHNCWVLPEERQFLTKELIEASCLVGTTDQLVERIGALGDAGLDQLMILPPFDPRYEVLERVGADIIPQLS